MFVMRANHKLSVELKWLVFLLPALLFYLSFSLLPTLSSTYYSLTDWDGVNSKFIGFSNYIEMFHDQMILTAFGNTAQFTVTITLFQNLFGLLLALLLVRKFAGVNFMKSLFFMPSIFSTLLIGYVWSFILEPNIGVVNNLLEYLHLSHLEVGWLSNPFWAKWVFHSSRLGSSWAIPWSSILRDFKLFLKSYTNAGKSRVRQASKGLFILPSR